jgi:hypothetical protein
MTQNMLLPSPHFQEDVLNAHRGERHLFTAVFFYCNSATNNVALTEPLQTLTSTVTVRELGTQSLPKRAPIMNNPSVSANVFPSQGALQLPHHP